MIHPKTTNEARQVLANASIHPHTSLTVGAIVCTVIGFILWGLISLELSYTDLFLCQLASFYFVGWLGIKQIEVAKHGVGTLFGSLLFEDDFYLGKKSIFQAGYHWLPPFICTIEEIDTRERSIKIGRMKVVVLDPLTKQSGISVVFEDGQISYIPFDLFAILKTGEKDIDLELESMAQEQIRDQASSLKVRWVKNRATGAKEAKGGPELVFKADTNKAIMKSFKKEDEEVRWGIFVVKVTTPKIDFADADTAKAFEARYVELRQRESQAEQAKTVIENAKSFRDELGISPERALTSSERSSELLRPSDVVLLRSTDNKSDAAGTADSPPTVGDDLIVAAVIQTNGGGTPPAK